MEEEDTNVEMLSYKNTIISSTIKDIIKKSLSENLLQDIDYSEKKCDELIKLIADDIKNRLKALPQPRYKFVVQVVIGERREQGIRTATRCFWDTNSDSYASETFVNDDIFCSATAFAMYNF